MRVVIPTEMTLPDVPPAMYKARFSGHKVKPTKDGTKSRLNLELTILSQGPSPEIKTIGRKVFDGITIEDATLWRLNLPFKAVTGKDINEVIPPGTEVGEEELVNMVVASVMNQEVIVNIVHRPFEGQNRVEVSAYKSIN